MSVTLYTTNCPKCKVLEAKLQQKKIEYEPVTDEDFMIKRGFQSVPKLEVEGVVMDFGDALKWVDEQ